MIHESSILSSSEMLQNNVVWMQIPSDRVAQVVSILSSGREELFAQLVYDTLLRRQNSAGSYLKQSRVWRLLWLDGVVDRSQVAVEGKRLNGFSRPINRILDVLVESGQLPPRLRGGVIADYGDDRGAARVEAFRLSPDWMEVRERCLQRFGDLHLEGLQE